MKGRFRKKTVHFPVSVSKKIQESTLSYFCSGYLGAIEIIWIFSVSCKHSPDHLDTHQQAMTGSVFLLRSGLTEKSGFQVGFRYRILGLRLPFCSFFCFYRDRL